MFHSAMLMLDFSDSFKGQSWNGFLKKRELIAGNFKQQMTWPRNENYITKWRGKVENWEIIIWTLVQILCYNLDH